MTGVRTQDLEAAARAEGFDWFGVAEADFLAEEHERLVRWLEEGRHGQMEWLARDPHRRATPAAVLEGCRAVVVVGMNYLRGDVEEPPPAPGHGRISKYARTRDYHRVIEKRLRRLARAIDEQHGGTTRGFVDYGPVMERPWAVRAGIGFLGKHTLVIHAREGSFHFLGVLLTTTPFEPTTAGAGSGGCGDCRRCLDACPTAAITEPWRLDARRCLSYLTIEHQGPVDREFWPQFEGAVFGCDICQDVCPYNRSRAVAAEDSPLGEEVAPGDIPLEEWLEAPEAWLGTLGGTSSPLRRPGAENLRRNAVIVAADRGDAGTLEALGRLAARRDLPDWLREDVGEAFARLRERLEGRSAP